MAKARVLIVEDERLVAEALQRSLETLGFGVSAVVSSGEKAVDRAKETQPDLVLMDIVLEGEMDGIEAAQKIGTLLNIPVVYVTAYADEVFLERAKVSWPYGYVIKPFEVKEVKVAVEMALYRHKMEKALRASEERFSKTFHSNPNPVAITTLDEGRYIDLNASYERATGYSRDEAVGRTSAELKIWIDPKDRSELLEMLENHRRARLSELKIRTKKGEIRTMMFAAEKIVLRGEECLITGATDITERKQAEEALEEERFKLKEYFENLPLLGFNVAFDGKIEDCNEFAVKKLGYNSKHELIGKPLISAIYAPSSQKKAKQLFEKWRKEKKVRNEEVQIITKQGEIIDVLLNVDTIYDHNGTPLHSLSTQLDITERKRAEEELRGSQQQLIHAQKMEALGSLVAGVAHEVNNPINLIMFNIPLLQKIWHDFLPVLEKQTSLEPHRKYGGLTYDFLKENLSQLLSDMDMAANRVTKIVQGLKGFAKQTDITERQPIQINEAVQNAIRIVQSTLRKSGVDLKLDLGHDLPRMEGNLQSIEQIILNLVINATEAVDHGEGEIKVTTGYEKPKGQLFVSVRDNGRGIDPSITDRIFDPFVTDRQTEGGTGLGLSVTYNLVRAHDGEIAFKTEEGKGTTFTVLFPTKLKEKRVKILVVDDDKTIRDTLADALTRNRAYVVERASNGTEALIKLGTYCPDLLILDILMPEMDGAELCRAIDNEPELSGMKVMIITGHPTDAKLEKVKELGFRNIYPKPFAYQDFVKEVEKVLKN